MKLDNSVLYIVFIAISDTIPFHYLRVVGCFTLYYGKRGEFISRK